MNKVILLLTCLFILLSCNNEVPPPTTRELYDKCNSGVVLIAIEYYYEIRFNNNTSGYFTQIENGEIKDLVFNEEELDTPNLSFGTGFFISENGKIATNRHVVEVQNDTELVKKKLSYKFNILRVEINDRINTISSNIREIRQIMNTNYLSISDYQLASSKIQELENERDELGLYERVLMIEPMKSRFICHKSVGIAYNNTHLSKWSDFKECVIVKQSKEEDIDLAVIQLKNKQTPRDCYVFDFDDHNPNIGKESLLDRFEKNTAKNQKFSIYNPLNINEQVYMIGYNHGMEIATTTDGLKSQITQGFISQESDNYRVLYSIPTLQGSSGSPILDKWGNLVAVNFAQVRNSQSFNYGILTKHLKKLVEE